MSRAAQNQSFICKRCHKHVMAVTNGSYRNHCPFCLYSVHVDNQPGDRGQECHGLMKPINVVFNSKKGFQIVQQCLQCGIKKVNVLALNTIQEDNYDLIIQLQRHPKI